MIDSPPQRHNQPDDDVILSFWDRGRDTMDIADRYGCPEYVIANRLPRLLWARRQTMIGIKPVP